MDDLARRQDVDVHRPHGREVLRRRPAHRADVAYTYNRILHGKTEQASWISYLTGVTSITAPNATTVVLKLKQPNATLPLLPIPIVPEHVWKNVSESAVKTYTAEPSNGKPVVGEGPFRLVQGTADGDTFKFEVNPDYWAGRAAHRRGRSSSSTRPTTRPSRR